MKDLREKRMEEIISYLGRKPKSIREYRKIWRYLFEGDIEKKNKLIRKQRTRHLSHTGPASISRQYCMFCEKEKNG